MPAKIRAILKRSDEPIGHVTNICNEEGRLLGLPHNCTINDFSFVGDIAIVGIDGDDFGDCPISFDQWKEIINA